MNILPKAVIPEHYQLNLSTDFNDFKGKVIIISKVLEASSLISLNVDSLEIHSITIQQQPCDFTIKSQLLHITPHSELNIQQIINIEIDFSGTVSESLQGFYKSKSKQDLMLVTYFAPTFARKAFPCFDQPDMKATFELTITHPNNMTALSNTPVKTHMYNSLTQLLAFAVGNFDYVEDTTKSTRLPIKCRVYTPKGQSEDGKFALQVCTKTLELYERLFGIPYVLSKMDLLAVPDFEMGAMENWGLVTYRSASLLFNDKTGTDASKQRVAVTVAHENAHQWFGNLVTMTWWNDLWLNEGFATWLGWYAVNELFPEWRFWDQFLVGPFKNATELDSLTTTHPIQVDVNNPDEIGQIFDAISYQKGASLIRMLGSFLGEVVFLKGVQVYLDKFKFGNAKTADLWECVSKVSGVDVASMTKVWTGLGGFPVLKINEAEGLVELEQMRYLINPDFKDETQWQIPLNAVGISSVAKLMTLKSLTLETSSDATFYLFNKNSTAFYRVCYPETRLQQFGQLIQSNSGNDVLSANDRLVLLSDTFAMATAGHLNTVAYLQFLSNFSNETDFMVLREMKYGLGILKRTWNCEGLQVQKALARLESKLFSSHVSSFTWQPQTDHLASMKQKFVLEIAGGCHDETLAEECKRRFHLFVKGNFDSIPSSLQTTVFQIAVSHGDALEFSQLETLYNEAEEDLKLKLLEAFGSSTQTEMIKRGLAFALSGKVRDQDLDKILISASHNPKAWNILLLFVFEKWDVLSLKFGESLRILGRIVDAACSHFASFERAAEIEEFFADKQTTRISLQLMQTLERIRSQAYWLRRDRENVAEWLLK